MAGMKAGGFVLVLLLSNSCFVWTKVTLWKDPHNEKVINLKNPGELDSVLTRIRRQILRFSPGLGVPTSSENNHHSKSDESGNFFSDTVEDTRNITVHRTVFNDSFHNEAIVHWSGKGSKAVFLLTRRRQSRNVVTNSTMYRSMDFGRSFTPLPFPKSSVIKTMYIDPNNPKKLVFSDQIHKCIYFTKDEGEKIEGPFNTSFSPDKLYFSPTLEDWLLAHSYSGQKVYVTKDLGMTWGVLQEHVMYRLYWAVPGQDDNYTVHMEVQDKSTGMFNYKGCTIQWTTGLTPSCVESAAQKQQRELLGAIDIVSLVVQNEYIFAQKTHYSSTLYVSYKRGLFHEAFFPSNFHAVDFSLIKTDEHQVFIAGNVNNMVNLFLSDITGRRFVKTLENIVREQLPEGSFQVDLYEVEGVPGTFIANKYESRGRTKTYITYDKGGNWSLIQAQDEKCQLPNCSLNLHLILQNVITQGAPPQGILSEKNAPGVVIAHGNEGAFLQSKPINSYMSRDGGSVWTKVFTNDSHLFAILNQGGAIVAVPYTGKTNLIRYSSDEGLTWGNYSFKATPFNVDGLLNEPEISSLVVSIYGHERYPAGWVVLLVDFADLLSTPCKQSDYEQWSPADKFEKQRCILGEKLIYERRKQDANCYVNPDYERPINRTVCQCTEEDFECDFGYVKNKQGICNKTKWFRPPVGECPENTFYNQSHGYRKVAADKCIAGVSNQKKYQSTRVQCPIVSPAYLEINTKSQKTVAATKSQVVFQLKQGYGTKNSTVYKWDFGDGNSTVIKGMPLHGTLDVNHTYHNHGIFTVNVTATNDKGTNRATYLIRVEDMIIDMDVELPHGAAVTSDTLFTVTIQAQNLDNSQSTGNVHFIWSFGDEDPETLPLLTWNSTVKHRYMKPGHYKVEVQAINAVSSKYWRDDLTVYETVTTIQFTFSPYLDVYNQGTLGWRKGLEYSILDALQGLGLNSDRLQVVVLAGKPTKADISILPPNSKDVTDTKTSKEISSTILNKVNSGFYIRIYVDTSVKVVKAIILKDDSGVSPSKKSQVPTAVYIAVPVLFIAVLLAGLIILYYKKKLQLGRRYDLLHNRDHAGSLLDNDDDDDPPLDPNPDFPAEETEEDINNPFGDGARLEIRTNTLTSETSNSVDC